MPGPWGDPLWTGFFAVMGVFNTLWDALWGRLVAQAQQARSTRNIRGREAA